MSVIPTTVRPRTTPSPGQAATVTATGYPYASLHAQTRDQRSTNTVPNRIGAIPPADELGTITRPSSDGDEPQGQPQAELNGDSPTPRRRSRGSGAVPQSNRFTITNMTDNEISDDSPHINTPGPTSETASQPQPPQQKTWLTAEEEKARLYQEAIAKVERVQGGLDRAESIRVCLLPLSFLGRCCLIASGAVSKRISKRG
jgi:hypothetical protein